MYLFGDQRMRNCIGCGSIYFLISCADVYRRQFVLTEAKYAGEIITKYPWINLPYNVSALHPN